MHTPLNLTMPEGITKMNSRYDMLIEVADSIYSQEAFEYCYATLHDRHNNPYSEASENFVFGYLGLSIGSLVNQETLSPAVKTRLADENFRQKLIDNANLLLMALLETANEYHPEIVRDNNVTLMTKNAFANDILIQIDGTDGLEYSEQESNAFRKIAEFWGGYFEKAAPKILSGGAAKSVNDNGGDRMTQFVDCLESNLREMGIMHVEQDMHPHGALMMAFEAAGIAMPRDAYPRGAAVTVRDLNMLHYSIEQKQGGIAIA